MQDIVEPGSRKEFLNVMYPPDSSDDAMRFFNFLKTHISLQSNGMGVELRESRANIAILLEKEGFRYELYQNFIDLYESEIWKQEQERQDNQKNK